MAVFLTASRLYARQALAELVSLIKVSPTNDIRNFEDVVSN